MLAIVTALPLETSSYNKSSLFTNKEGSSEALGSWQASIGIQSLINAQRGKTPLGDSHRRIRHGKGDGPPGCGPGDPLTHHLGLGRVGWGGGAGSVRSLGCGHRLASLALERPPGGARSRTTGRAWAGKARGQRVPGRRGCGLGVSSRNPELGPLRCGGPRPSGVSQRVRTLGVPDGQHHRLSSGSPLVLHVKSCVPRLCGWTLEEREEGRGAHTHTQNPTPQGLVPRLPRQEVGRRDVPEGGPQSNFSTENMSVWPPAQA